MNLSAQCQLTHSLGNFRSLFNKCRRSCTACQAHMVACTIMQLYSPNTNSLTFDNVERLACSRDSCAASQW